MFVCCECCVLSGRGLCDELITRPEESYRLWCVVVCDLENLKNEEAMTRVWVSAPQKKISSRSSRSVQGDKEFKHRLQRKLLMNNSLAACITTQS